MQEPLTDILLDQHAPGAKLDHDKIDMDLVLSGFSLAIQEMCKVGTFGAKKYTEDGWMKVPRGIRRYSSAMQRHYFLEAEGEYLDQETELPHAAAVAWNALARLELILRREDDRG